MLERDSALAGELRSPGRDGADGLRPLRIGEARDWALMQVAGFPAAAAEFSAAMRSVVNVDLPPRIGAAVRADGRRLLKTGAQQYWIITRDDDEILSDLQRTVTAQIGAVTPLSHSRTCISIEGAPAREVLAKGVPVDFHPDYFRVDQFALTGLHHTPVLIYRRGADLYEIYAMRTFALSVWEWLTDAALQFGYEVGT